MAIDDLVHRNLARIGEDATVYNWTIDSYDDEGDPVFTETSSAIVAVFRQPQTVQGGVESPAGVRLETDTEVYVSDEHLSDITPATAENRRATEIERDLTGDRFVVVDVWPEANGQLRVGCTKAVN